MNLLAMQEQLRNFSEQQLVSEMQMPSGQVPQFLILTELNRRKRVSDQYDLDRAKGDQQTVAQELVAAAGLPAVQAGRMAMAMAPRTNMAGNTGATQAPEPQAPERRPTMMREGGIVALQQGGPVRGRPQLVVMDGRQFARMGDGSLIPMQSLGFSAADLSGAGRADLSTPTASQAFDGPVNPSYREDRSNVGAPLFAPQPQVDLGVAGGEQLPRLSRSDRAMLQLQEIAGQERAPTIGAAAPLPTTLGLPALAPLPNQYAGPGRPTNAPPDWMPDNYGVVPSTDIGQTVPGESSGPWWAAMDPDAAPGEALERFLFPYRDPAEIRRRRLAVGAQGGSPLTAVPDPAAGAAPSTAEGAAPGTAGASTGASASAPAAPSAAGLPAVAGAGSGAGSGAGAAGSATPGSFEEFIQQRMESAQADRRRDQWLALAQFGLQLMASDRPTLGGAIGEAGAQALGSLRASYQDYNRTMMELYGTREQLAERRAQAARAAQGTARPPSFSSVSTYLHNLVQRTAEERDRLAELARLNPEDNELRLNATRAAQRASSVFQEYLNLGGVGAPGQDEDIPDLSDTQ